MICISDKSICSGCSACASVCPRVCISMIEDKQGFIYPNVDDAKCIDCGLCEKVCHMLHPNEERNPLMALAAYNNDQAIRIKSSSGGVFSLLAEQTIMQGGVVFGARFDEKWQVKLDYTENKEGIALFRRSKYVQATVGSAFIECEKFLKDGRRVLFSGTPCQVAGLLHFLRKQYDNLTTIDVACHGVPSPNVWSMYLDLIRDKLNIKEPKLFLSEFKGLKFTIFYKEKENILELRSKRHENDYMRSFIYSLILRPSCYNCKTKNFRSNSDLTIADFWGIENIKPDYDNDKGTNLVLVNSQKGCDMLDMISATIAKVNMKLSITANPALTTSVPKPIFKTSGMESTSKDNLISLLRHGLQEYDKTKRRSIIRRFFKSIYNSVCFFYNQFLEKGTMVINRSIKIDRILKCSEIGDIISVDFRNKTNGWKKYGLSFKVQLKSKMQ